MAPPAPNPAPNAPPVPPPSRPIVPANFAETARSSDLRPTAAVWGGAPPVAPAAPPIQPARTPAPAAHMQPPAVTVRRGTRRRACTPRPISRVP
eukprot:1430916-Prymnesium_polylepis.1